MKKIKTSVYLDETLIEGIEREAKANERSNGYIVRKILTNALGGITLDGLASQIQNWQRDQFGEDRTSYGALNHISQEVSEALEDLEAGNKERLSLELADIFFLLMQVVDLNDIDIHAAIAAKLTTNKEREWVKPDENGVINHVN